MATSTAQRFRNRQQPESLSLVDAFVDLGASSDRSLFDALAVSDSVIPTHWKRRPGDSIENVTSSINTATGTYSGKSAILNKTDFPVIRDIGIFESQVGGNNFSGNHPDNVEQGDMLLYFITVSDFAAAGNVPTISGLDGLTAIEGPLSLPNPGTVERGFVAYRRIADGTEGGTTFDIDMSLSAYVVAHCIAVKNWSSLDGLPDITTRLAAIDSSVDISEISPAWLPKNTLWIAIVSYSNSGSDASVVSWADDYPDNRTHSYSILDLVGQLISSASLGKITTNPAGTIELSSSVNYDSMMVALSSGVDPEFIEFTDSVVLQKDQRKVLYDFVQPLDEGFITDRDIIRYRIMTDSCDATDDFQKSVTTAEGVVNNVTRKETIVLADGFEKTVSGIVVQETTDNISLSELAFSKTTKSRQSALDANDSAVKKRYVIRVLSDNVEVSEDVIVSRSAIENVSVETDTLSVTDALIASQSTAVDVTAKIKHGIERF